MMDTPRLDRIIRELEQLQTDADHLIHNFCLRLADRRRASYVTTKSREILPCGTTLNFVAALKRVKSLIDEPR
jgi:hypothetical protein